MSLSTNLVNLPEDARIPENTHRHKADHGIPLLFFFEFSVFSTERHSSTNARIHYYFSPAHQHTQ